MRNCSLSSPGGARGAIAQVAPYKAQPQCGEIRSEEIGVRNEEYKIFNDDTKLRGFDCVAESHGNDRRDLSFDKIAAEGGTVLSRGSDETGSGVGSFQYRRGIWPEKPEGVSPVFADSTRLGDGIGDPAEDMCEGGLPSTRYSGGFIKSAIRNQQNDLLTSRSSLLTPIVYDYIMGNPPFVGYGLQSAQQKADTLETYVDKYGKPYKTAGKIDYVANWYFKAAQLVQGENTRCAFVSTNSITQGEQVANVWQPVFERFHIHLDFAWRTFKWQNETTDKGNMAAVHCVIVGFSNAQNDKPKRIFSDEEASIVVDNINPYLMGGRTVWIKSRQKPLCNVPYMTTGNRPADGGHLIIESDEYEDFIRKEPDSKKWIKKLTGSDEYINGKDRYCLWLLGASPAQIKSMGEVYKRVQLCREDRLKGASDRQKLADTPTLFRELKNPEQYLIIPRVSSENRRYIPIGFLNKETIPTDSATIIIDAGLYHFGILTSKVHNAWMCVVCGRLKSDYRYSKDIVYNNFPWPNAETRNFASLQKRIEESAQAILDARALFSDSTLAELYDEILMPKPLRDAHHANDRAVMAAYGFDPELPEHEIVAELFRLYRELTE